MTSKTEKDRITPRTSDVLPAVGIFLFFNLIVAGIYFHIINP